MIDDRVATDYEACHYIVSVEEDKYRDDTGAYIELTLIELYHADAYIYLGTGLNNATAFIESNETAVLGAPFKVPISSTLIVVFVAQSERPDGRGSFTYKLVDGEEYVSFYKPFVGLEKWIWYLTLCSAIIVPFLLICILTYCCKYVDCCQFLCSCLLCPCCRPIDEEEEKKKEK